MLNWIISNAAALTWTVLAFVGIWCSAENAWEAWADYQALGGKLNGRRRIATDNLRREGSRLLVFGLAIAIGVLAVLDVEGPFVAIALITILLTLVVNSILDRRSRQYLMTFGMAARDDRGRFTGNDV